MKTIRLEVTDEYDGARLDVFIADNLVRLSRSQAQKLIKEGHVMVQGRSASKAGEKVVEGKEIVVTIPDPKPLNAEPEDIPLDILYEDSDLIVVNKPQGMVVHPAPGHFSGTLVNALLHRCRDLSGINGVLRPGIVHRLDKDTSGALVVAKNDYAHVSLAAQIKQHTVLRKYIALVHGDPQKDAGTIDAPIGRHPVYRKKMAVVANGRRAVTHYRVLERLGNYSLVEARLETGRTHQVRVHMAYLGHPIVGDKVYGPRKAHFDLPGQALHARLLGFVHPRSGEYMEFIAEPPAILERLLTRLRALLA